MSFAKIRRLTLLSLILNLAYAIGNLVIGISTYAWWFITLGVYYTALSLMRFFAIRSEQKQGSGKDISRLVGVIFVIVSISLVGTAILSSITVRGMKMHEIIMITVALYAFVKVTLAVINLVRVTKGDSQILRILRNISLAEAIVSIYSLQRSMLVSFGNMRESDIKLFNLLTGIGVCIAVLLLGINLIGGTRIEMAKSKIITANEKIASAVVDGYKKIENAVVSGYTKIEDKFVDAYLTKDGETVEEAKERLKKEKENK